MLRTWHRCLVALLSVILITSSAFATDISETIQTGTDDAADIGTTPTYDEDDNYYVHTSNTALNAIIGYRFQGVDIPAGATITAANLKVISFAGCAVRGGCVSNCFMVLADDPDTWSAGNRPKDASLSVGFGTMTVVGTDTYDGLYVVRNCNTSNSIPTKYLYEGVQEVVDRVGWASGQDMAVILKKQSVATGNQIIFYNYEGEVGAVAQLEITYTTGGVTPVFGQVIITSS